MAPVALKRCKIPYKYAVGLALKSTERLLAKEIYNFILVHMPKICTLQSNSWENAVRNALVIFPEMFEKIQVVPKKGKPQCFYKFSDGGVKLFNEEFSEEFGYPFDFLANPDQHRQLYHGKMGFPKEFEIDAAKIRFKEEQNRWAALPKELKETKKSRARKAKNSKKSDSSDENTDTMVQSMVAHILGQGTDDKENFVRCTDTVGIQMQHKRLPFCENNGHFQYVNTAPVYNPYDNQMPSYDYGYYHQQQAPGPIRTGIPSYSEYRMSPYERSSDVYQQPPMTMEQWSQFPPAHSFLEPVQMSQMPPMEPLDLQFASPSLPQGLIQEEDFQKYLGISDATIAGGNDIFDQYFSSPNCNPPQVVEPVLEQVSEPLSEVLTTDDSDPSYWFVM